MYIDLNLVCSFGSCGGPRCLAFCLLAKGSKFASGTLNFDRPHEGASKAILPTRARSDRRVNFQFCSPADEVENEKPRFSCRTCRGCAARNSQPYHSSAVKQCGPQHGPKIQRNSKGEKNEIRIRKHIILDGSTQKLICIEGYTAH